jgi:integrase
MSTARRPPRLWLRPTRRDKVGAIIGQATYIIVDRGQHIATGCFAGEAESAGRELAKYIAEQYEPQRKARDIERIKVGDVLLIHHTDNASRQSDPKKFAARIARLNAFLGDLTLSDINKKRCRDYEAWRKTASGARRELEDLRSAINHHKAEGLHRGEIVVTLPEKSEGRTRWLTRNEAAKLLWTCWRTREKQRGEMTDKRPLRHLARFILIGLYTGTRAASIAAASTHQVEGRSWVDLDRGIFYRRQIGRRKTKKRQMPAPIPPRLLAHMRRWHRLGIAKEHFVEFNGKPVKSVKTAFASAVKKAKIPHCSPHSLRHTAATWLMQNRAPLWQAAGYLSMSEQTLETVYGHHHLDYVSEAVDAINRPKPKKPTPKASEPEEPVQPTDNQ